MKNGFTSSEGGARIQQIIPDCNVNVAIDPNGWFCSEPENRYYKEFGGCNRKPGILLSLQEFTTVTRILYAKLYAK